MILIDVLGPNIGLRYEKKDKFCIVSERIPSWKSVCNELVTSTFLLRLSEISGDCEKIVFKCYIPKLPGKQQQCEELSNTPKLSPMDEGHKQPDSPEVSS